ncbi:MAG: hypothetical protein E7508_08815 [Ruminococcus sp.]|nr:hypothetical protein [Ruminococcus sp.]
MKLFKKISVIMTALTISIFALSMVSVSAFTDITTASEISVIKSDEQTNRTTASVNATNINLYAIDSTYDEFMQIPENYNTSFQLEVTGAKNVSYTVSDGDSVEVSETGLITPASEIWYWSGGFGTTSYIEGAEVVTEYIYGDSVVTVTADNKTFDVNVSVQNYAVVYAHNIMDTYIADNITSSMTTYEKLEIIAQFVASYDYNASYSSAVSMIVTDDGGDCWASTDAIVIMAEKLGLEAWWRNGNRDPGSGSGHINAMVYDGETYFEVEAGYTGSAPRHYYIETRDNLFSVTYNSEYEGYEIYQYDGPTMPEELTIPSSINGYDVVSIGDSFLVGEEDVKKVNLPSTIKSLGDWAFSGSGITTFELPESVEKIGQGTFNLPYLENFTGNSKFAFYDGMLYDVENDVLVAVPNAKSVNIPDTCAEIGGGAFYWNKNIKEVIIPPSVTKVGQGAFYYCDNLRKVELGENVTSVGDFAFYGIDNLKGIIVLNPDCTFGENQLNSYFKGTIYGHENSTAQAYAEMYGYTFDLIENAGNLSIERPIGDANCDNALTVSDAAFIARTLAKRLTISVDENPYADYNGDGKVTVADAAAIARELAKPKTDF